jgi:hypothetical protein
MGRARGTHGEKKSGCRILVGELEGKEGGKMILKWILDK